MQSNLPTSDYIFTSAIPDVLTLSQLSAKSILFEVELNGETIFSTTLYAYNATAQLYDLRSLVEDYMEQNNLTTAPCCLHYDEEQTDTFHFIYFKYHVGTSCRDYLLSHFLTTSSVRLVPHSFQFDLPYITFPSEESVAYTLVLLRPDDGSAPTAYTLAEDTITSTEFRSQVIDLNEPDLLQRLPEGASGTLLSVTVVRGRRTFTLYLTDRTPSLTLNFRNEFNALDTLHLNAQTKRTLTFERSTATCCGETSYYDDNSSLEYECATSLLTPPEARYLTFVLQRPHLTLILADTAQSTPIVVTDIESEISNAQNALNRITFKCRPVNNRQSLTYTAPKRIFNSNYNAVYK